MAIEIADIVAEFGAYYVANGKSVRDIRLQLMSANETDKLFVFRPTKDTQLEGGSVDIGPVLQAYQDAFTEYGDVTFGGRVIPLHKLKIDIEKNPDKLEASWLGFLTDKKLKRSEWPFPKWLISALIIPKIQEDWELNGVFKGAVTAVVPGTPHPIANSVNGIKTVINAAIDAGSMEPIVVGAVPTDPVDYVDYVEEFVDQIPKEAMPFLQQLAMSDTLYKRFKKGMRKKYNMNYAQADLVTVIDTNLQVEGFRSHEGSGKIWTTIRGNAEMGMKKPGNDKIFNVEESKRQLAIMTDFYKGLGYWRDELVYTNDVELPA